MSKANAKNINEDVVIRQGYDLYLEDKMYNSEGKEVTGRPYKVYTALLSQTGTDAPVATVLENSIGAIVWTRALGGYFKGTLTGAFTANKTFCLVTRYDTAQTKFCAFGRVASSNEVELTSFTDAGALSDGMNAQVEIRVYN